MNGGFSRRIIGAVIAVILVVAVAAYVFYAVVRTNSGQQTQNSIGTHSFVDR